MLRGVASSTLCVLALTLILGGCASGPNKDGLSGPSIDPPNEDYYGSGHSRTTTNTDEVNVGLGRYKKTF